MLLSSGFMMSSAGGGVT